MNRQFKFLFKATSLLLAMACWIPALAIGPSVGWRQECIGHYTISLPGDLEYALVPLPLRSKTSSIDYRFKDVIGATGTVIEFRLPQTFQGAEVLSDVRMDITAPATEDDLVAAFDRKNAEQQTKKEELLDWAKHVDENPEFSRDIDPSGAKRRDYRLEAGRIPSFERIPGKPAFVSPPRSAPKPDRGAKSDHEASIRDFYVLVDGHIILSSLPVPDSAPSSLANFVSHFQPRTPFETPASRGACIPFGFIPEGVGPSRIAFSIRLKDLPDIVIFLSDTPIDESRKDPAAVLKNGQGPTFYGAEDVRPMDRSFKHVRTVRIADREGAEAFVQITRKRSRVAAQEFDNPEGEVDWGYIAFVPGNRSEAAGGVSDLTLKIERFARFAKRPMTESDFRELVRRIVSTIKRLP